jgi:prevent-host-death family protein
MRISVSDAKAQLTDLVRRAEAGEDVVLTRRGHPAVRLVPAAPAPVVDREARRRALQAFHGILKDRPGWEGLTAENCTDFLYDEHGLPA